MKRTRGPVKLPLQIQNRPRVRYGPVRRSSHVPAPIAHYLQNRRDAPLSSQLPGHRYRFPVLFHLARTAQGLPECDRLHPACRRRSDHRLAAVETSAPPPTSPAHAVYNLFAYILLSAAEPGDSEAGRDESCVLEGDIFPLLLQSLLIGPPRCTVPDFKVVAHPGHSYFTFEPGIRSQPGRDTHAAL